MRKHIPNALTLLRAVGTIGIAILLLSSLENKYLYAYALFIFTALTDFFDGRLARRWGTVSDFGIIFDPLFDKLLVLTLFMLLFPFDIVHPAILLILFMRDIVTDAMRNYLLSRGVVSPAIMTSKLKTVFQMIMINFMLLFLAFPLLPYTQEAAVLSGVIAIALSLWSGGIYTRDLIRFSKSAVSLE